MEYLVKSSAIIAVFYIFYRFFSRNETHFKAIRFFFLLGLVFSLIIPTIGFIHYVEVAPELITDSYIINDSSSNEKINKALTLNTKVIIYYIYSIGALLFILQFALRLASLILLLRKHKLKKEDGYIFIETDKTLSPFSFFNYIVYNPNQFEKNELKQIITHEKNHAIHLHSIDTILIHLFTIFQWFNPFIWLYKKELLQNLEYITDDITQQHVSCKKSYQKLLLKTGVPNYKIALANNFYNSLLKKRILMLHKEKSKHRSKWKLALIAPILLLFILVFNTKTIAQSSDSKEIIVEEKLEIIELLISKKTSKEALKKIKDEFSTKGLQVAFSGVKRNNDDEIIAIKVDAKADNGKASASYVANNDTPIKPIKISFDGENNHLSIGSTHGNSFHYSVSDHGGKHIINRKGNGHTEDIIHIETNGDHTEDTNVRVWTSKDGKHKKIKRSKEVIVEIDDDGNETKKEIIKIRGKGNKDNIFIFEDDDNDEGTAVTYIVNGKKITKEELKKMDPDKIKTIEIKKEVKKKKKN